MIPSLKGCTLILDEGNKRIEGEQEVCAYIQNLKYALEHGAKITFQEHRRVDQSRQEQYTNKYTVADLFPDEDPVDALRRELGHLTVEEYIETVKDIQNQERSEMRVFGRTYGNGKRAGDVYIKIRVELLPTSVYGDKAVFVMSFHYAITPFVPDIFPYRRKK